MQKQKTIEETIDKSLFNSWMVESVISKYTTKQTKFQ